MRSRTFCRLNLSLDVKTVRYDTLKVAKRLEAELGEEQASCIEGEPSDWDLTGLRVFRRANTAHLGHSGRPRAVAECGASEQYAAR